MLTAWAGMVIAIDMVHTGQDATAKDCFLKSFEILRKDSLYMPIAGLYRRLMGLPDACLRNRYPRQYRSVCNLAKRVEPLRTSTSDFAALTADLSPRETSFAQLAASGRTNGEISAFIGVSTHTVKYHLANVYAKLGISGRQELAQMTAEYLGK